MGDPATGKLTLLPGLICDDTVWAAQVRDLADFAPVAINGYGAADSITAMAEHVLAAVPGTLALVGHSMGARVALEAVRIAPDRVERLALLDTGVHPLAEGEIEKREALLQLGRDDGMDALIDAWLPPMVHPDRQQDEQVMNPLVAMCQRAGFATFERQVRALIGRPDARPLLPTITCPVLVGVGSHDAWSPVEQHRDIAARLPDAELVIFDDAGHMAPFETPEPVNAALRHWMSRPVLE
jgi:pimeloyl-ACP methyl ester carboxylesterase